MLGSTSPPFFAYVANWAFSKYDMDVLVKLKSEAKTFKNMNTMLNFVVMCSFTLKQCTNLTL